MVRRWILVLLLTSMSIILISDEEGRAYIEKLRDKYAVDACDFNGWLSVEETSIYLPVFGLDSPIYSGEDYLDKITHSGWLEVEFRDEKPYMAVSRSIDGTGCGIYSEGYERAVWEALNKIDKENAVVLVADGEQFIADIEDRLVMVSSDEYLLNDYNLKTVAELNQAVEKVVEVNRKKDPHGQLIGGVMSIKEILYADECELSNSDLDETSITETNEIKYEVNDFELTIVYVNNSEKFINDCTDNSMENIGEDNLVVQIVKKHN